MTFATALKLAKPFLPWLAAIAALLGIWLYIGNLKSTVRDQQGAINVLTVEKDNLKRDVAGLVVLAQGQAKVADLNKKDAAILSETIDAKNPQPASRGLADLLAGLRKADADSQHATTNSPSR